MDDGDGDHILRANANDANGLDCVGGPHCDRAAKATRKQRVRKRPTRADEPLAPRSQKMESTR